ncbi:MAG: glycosyltransferase family 2 protein [Phycisphaerales bacterium]|nr:glycosyltransferase family 2 protein [Phycisphaerales bacterium]
MQPSAGVESLSIVLPCRNEAENVARVVRAALREGSRVASRVEVIVVNDGSTDDTGMIGAELAREDPRVRVVTHEVGRGYGAALRSGFDAALMDFVFWTDGDGQFDLGELGSLLGLLGAFDAAIGFRRRRRDNIVRRLNGFCWTWLMRWMLGVRSRDVDCAFKVFPREFLQGVGLVSNGAMISAEILARASRAGLRIGEVGVRHQPRIAGTPSGGSLRVIAKAFAELRTLRRLLAAGARPGDDARRA